MASEKEASCETDPNFAIICAFIEKFGSACGLTDTIDFLELQSMLENNQEVAPELVNLHIKLLRKARKSVSAERWERALVNICHTFCSKDAWEIERFGYKKSRLSCKLRALKGLLEMQFDCNIKFKNEINKMSAEQLRSQPLGRDKLGHAYWFQSDNNYQIRVYKEDPDEETWNLVVKDRNQFVNLIGELTDGDSKISSDSLGNEDSNSLLEKPLVLDTGQVSDNLSLLEDNAVLKNGKSIDDDSQEPIKLESKENEKKEPCEEEAESPKRPMLRIKAMSELLESSKLKTIEIKKSADDETNIAKKLKLANEDLVGPAIESELMSIQGEGSGTDNCCGNNLKYCVREEDDVGEEIEEPVMYIYGEGSGRDCRTGNEKDSTDSTSSAISTPANQSKLPIDSKSTIAENDSQSPKKSMFFFGPGCFTFKSSQSSSTSEKLATTIINDQTPAGHKNQYNATTSEKLVNDIDTLAAKVSSSNTDLNVEDKSEIDNTKCNESKLKDDLETQNESDLNSTQKSGTKDFVKMKQTTKKVELQETDIGADSKSKDAIFTKSTCELEIEGNRNNDKCSKSAGFIKSSTSKKNQVDKNSDSKILKKSLDSQHKEVLNADKKECLSTKSISETDLIDDISIHQDKKNLDETDSIKSVSEDISEKKSHKSIEILKSDVKQTNQTETSKHEVICEKSVETKTGTSFNDEVSQNVKGNCTVLKESIDTNQVTVQVLQHKCETITTELEPSKSDYISQDITKEMSAISKVIVSDQKNEKLEESESLMEKSHSNEPKEVKNDVNRKDSVLSLNKCIVTSLTSKVGLTDASKKKLPDVETLEVRNKSHTGNTEVSVCTLNKPNSSAPSTSRIKSNVINNWENDNKSSEDKLSPTVIMCNTEPEALNEENRSLSKKLTLSRVKQEVLRSNIDNAVDDKFKDKIDKQRKAVLSTGDDEKQQKILTTAPNVSMDVSMSEIKIPDVQDDVDKNDDVMVLRIEEKVKKVNDKQQTKDAKFQDNIELGKNESVVVETEKELKDQVKSIGTKKNIRGIKPKSISEVEEDIKIKDNKELTVKDLLKVGNVKKVDSGIFTDDKKIIRDEEVKSEGPIGEGIKIKNAGKSIKNDKDIEEMKMKSKSQIGEDVKTKENVQLTIKDLLKVHNVQEVDLMPCKSTDTEKNVRDKVKKNVNKMDTMHDAGKSIDIGKNIAEIKVKSKGQVEEDTKSKKIVELTTKHSLKLDNVKKVETVQDVGKSIEIEKNIKEIKSKSYIREDVSTKEAMQFTKKEAPIVGNLKIVGTTQDVGKSIETGKNIRDIKIKSKSQIGEDTKTKENVDSNVEDVLQYGNSKKVETMQDVGKSIETEKYIKEMKIKSSGQITEGPKIKEIVEFNIKDSLAVNKEKKVDKMRDSAKSIENENRIDENKVETKSEIGEATIKENRQLLTNELVLSLDENMGKKNSNVAEILKVQTESVLPGKEPDQNEPRTRSRKRTATQKNLKILVKTKEDIKLLFEDQDKELNKKLEDENTENHEELSELRQTSEDVVSCDKDTKTKSPKKVTKVQETPTVRITRQTRSSAAKVDVIETASPTKAKTAKKNEPKKKSVSSKESSPSSSLKSLDVVVVKTDTNSSGALDEADKDPLAMSAEEEPPKTEVTDLNRLSFDYVPGEIHSSLAAIRAIRKRKREDVNAESKVEIQSPEKRAKIKGKRGADLSIRKSVEEKRQKIGSSDENDSESEEKSKSLNCVKSRKVKKKIQNKKESKSESSEEEEKEEEVKPLKKNKKDGPNKNRRLLLNLGINPEDTEKITSITSMGVRQSRRIAQIKIKEDADRRSIEDMIEKPSSIKTSKNKEVKDDKRAQKRKRNKEEEIESPIEIEKKKHKKKKKHKTVFHEGWHSSSDSSCSSVEEEEEVIEYSEEDQPLQFFKSDHEFSPESDLESESEALPLKRARTVKKDSDEEIEDEFPCQKCGKSDHPEWILLCDKCDNGWHCSCLRPPLFVIPEGDWYCPPCQHETLIQNLQEKLKEYDKQLVRKEMEDRRKERLAYVGISLNNVLPSIDKTTKSHLSKEESSDEESYSDSSDDSDEPIYQLRQRRQAHSYKFSDYDALINSAIGDEVVEKEDTAGNLGRGKDISTIVNAEKEREKNKKEEAEVFPSVVPKNTDLNNCDVYSDDDQIVAAKKKSSRKKSRKLNSLEVVSEDEESDEDFKGLSSESEEEEFNEEYDSDDSMYIRNSRKKNLRPTRRSTRARTSRFDTEFINDGSDDDVPRKKKKRSIWDESEDSEESDKSWGQQKSKNKSSHRKKKKKHRSLDDSDLEIYRKKKPKIKYGRIEDDDFDSGRRTRGKKMTYVDTMGSDSEEEDKRRSNKLASDEEFVLDEDDKESEEEAVLSNRDNSGSESDQPLKVSRLKMKVKNRILDDDDEDEEEKGDGEEKEDGKEHETNDSIDNDTRKSEGKDADCEKPANKEQEQVALKKRETEKVSEVVAKQVTAEGAKDVVTKLSDVISSDAKQREEKEKDTKADAARLEMKRKEVLKQLLESSLGPEFDKTKRNSMIDKILDHSASSNKGFLKTKYVENPLTGGCSESINDDDDEFDDLSEPPRITLPLFSKFDSPSSSPSPEDPENKPKESSLKITRVPPAVARIHVPAATDIVQKYGEITLTKVTKPKVERPKSNIEIAAPPQPFSQSQPTPSVITRMLQSSPGKANYPVGTIRPKQFARMSNMERSNTNSSKSTDEPTTFGPRTSPGFVSQPVTVSPSVLRADYSPTGRNYPPPTRPVQRPSPEASGSPHPPEINSKLERRSSPTRPRNLPPGQLQARPPYPSYTYPSYPPPSEIEEPVPTSFEASSFSEPEHYDENQQGAASESSNSKSVEDESGGEFSGLVSYFSSQQDDLDT